MANYPDTYWTVDGISLQTYAMNLETLDGRSTIPELRGNDITIPHRPGEVWVPKQPNSRVITLAGWVRGTNDNGVIPVGGAKNQFDDNWRALQRLLFTPGRQFLLKKKFYSAGVLREARALAEFAGGLEPSMIGRTAARFTVNIKLADPYFYDDTPTTINLSNGSNIIPATGDYTTTNISFSILGARTQPEITHVNMGLILKYNDALLSGDYTDINAYEYKSETYAGGTMFNSEGKIVHTGAPYWFALRPGGNTINLTSSFGTGAVSLTYRGAWL